MVDDGLPRRRPALKCAILMTRPLRTTPITTATNDVRQQAVPFWAVIFCITAALWALLVWFPLSRVGAHYSIEYNEGFNAYAEQSALNGRPIYGAPPQFTWVNYPPLSFHLIAEAARVTGDVNLTGRWSSLAAYLAIAALAAMIVYRLFGSVRYGFFSGVCWLIWLASLAPERIGYNDPHVLGLALSAAGFYCYVRGGDSRRWLMASACLFAASLFVKQSLIALPAAAAVQIFIESKQKLGVWLGTAAGACCVLLTATFALDGRFFLQHMDLPRTWALAGTMDHLSTYVLLLQMPMLIAICWVWSVSSGSNRILALAAIIAHVEGAVFCAGAGAGSNHLFEAMLSLAMITGAAVPELLRLVRVTRFQSAFATLVVVAPFFFTSALNLPRRIPFDLAQHAIAPRRESDFESQVALLRSRPGPAICENLLLCFDAGKPFTYDPFEAGEAFKTGRVDESRILELLEHHEFAAIELGIRPTEPLRPAARYRFSAAFMRVLFAQYTPVFRGIESVVFVPKT